jgi:outer membrane receptor protein involved in Fe transport
VRAPNINELFSPGGSSRNNIVQFSGPRAGQSTLVDFITAGNPNLKPEVGKTWTIGASLRPKFTRFRFSADYYDIKLSDQIGTAGVQVIVDLCRQGRADLCRLITFDAQQNITAVLNANVNNNGFRVRGIDFEASYTQPLSELWSPLKGTLTGRALATRTLEFASVTIAGREDKVGQNANGVLAGEPPNMPTWLANYSLTYNVGRFSGGVSFRYISPGVLESTSVTGTNTTRLNNKIGSQTTTNFQASYILYDKEGRRLQLYGVINNAFNRGPPFPIYPVTQWPAFYDTLGMVMRAGVRFQY